MDSMHVSILMATYCGEKFIQKQIESIHNQSYKNWSLWISDDGSNDGTLDIIRSCMEKTGNISLRKGPGAGHVMNFFSLVKDANILSGIYAFSDQDDIWHANKIESAVRWISQQPENVPAMYFTRLQLIDEAGRKIGISPRLKRPASFENALVQSIANGNTIVFNKCARDLIAEIRHEEQIISHDWITYMAIAGAGGRIRYCDTPDIDYRQHAANLVGGDTGIRCYLKKCRRMKENTYRQWTDANLQALESIRTHLTAENRSLLDTFIQMRNKTLFDRIRSSRSCGFYKQSGFANFALWLALVLGRI